MKSLPVVTNCDGCGACCTGQAALPVNMVGSTFRMPSCSPPLPPELEAELREAAERFEREGWPADGTPCIWYDAEARRCRHYEHRPTLCRDEVEPGDDACRRWRRASGVDPVRRYRLDRGRITTTTQET